MTGKSGDSTEVRSEVRAESKMIPRNLTDDEEGMARPL